MTAHSARQTILTAVTHIAQGKLHLQRSRTLLTARPEARELDNIASGLNQIISPLAAIRQTLALEDLLNETELENGATI